MVTVLYRQRHGYDVRIHSDDHEPAHVHVFKEWQSRPRFPESNLDLMKIMDSTVKELRKIRRLIELHLELLRDHWEIIHR